MILSRIYHNQFYTFTSKIHNKKHNSGRRSSSTHYTATIRVKVQPPRCVPAASSFWCFKSARCSADSASIESNTSTGRFSLIAFPTSPCWCVGCWTTVDLKTRNEKNINEPTIQINIINNQFFQIPLWRARSSHKSSCCWVTYITD